VILNEDLEEIGDNGLNFNWNPIDEVYIPKTVKSIGKYGVASFKKVYLYRHTSIDLFGYSDNGVSQLVYLD